MIAGEVWGPWVNGLLTLTGTLAVIEMAVLFFRKAPGAASGDGLDS